MRSYLLPPLLLLLAAASVCKASCPEDWKAYKDKCYRLVNLDMNCDDANEVCTLAHSGARLASVHDIDQNAFLTEDVAGHHGAWLGLRRPTTNGSWTWSDGSDFDFNNWATPYEPDGEGEQGTMLNCIRTGMWCSYPCPYDLPFICQFDA